MLYRVRLELLRLCLDVSDQRLITTRPFEEVGMKHRKTHGQSTAEGEKHEREKQIIQVTSFG